MFQHIRAQKPLLNSKSLIIQILMPSLQIYRATFLWNREDAVVITAQKYSKRVYSVFILYWILLLKTEAYLKKEKYDLAEL